MRISGRKPCQCKCKKCKDQCHTPCLGIPQDIERLIDAGYIDRLAPTCWGTAVMLGIDKEPVYMIQAKTEGDFCTFYHDGLCELHDLGLKPTEGRLSYHTIKKDSIKFRKNVAYLVAHEWDNPDNADDLQRLLNKIEHYESVSDQL